jgi:hypothetical protein
MAKAEFRIPTLTEIAPDVAALIAQRDDLRGRAVTARHKDLELARSSPVEGAPPNDQQIRVAALLGESQPPPTKSAREQRTEFAREIADLELAATMLDGQIRSKIAAAAVMAREAVEPEFKRRVRDVCAALIAAHSANGRLRQITTAMEDAGFTTGNWNQWFPDLLGHPNDNNGRVSHYLREACKAGLIDRSHIPTELSGA